jgi:hypothetical protein
MQEQKKIPVFQIGPELEQQSDIFQLFWAFYGIARTSKVKISEKG